MNFINPIIIDNQLIDISTRTSYNLSLCLQALLAKANTCITGVTRKAIASSGTRTYETYEMQHYHHHHHHHHLFSYLPPTSPCSSSSVPSQSLQPPFPCTIILLAPATSQLLNPSTSLFPLCAQFF